MSDKQKVKKQLKRKFVVFMTHSEFAESGVPDTSANLAIGHQCVSHWDTF